MHYICTLIVAIASLGITGTGLGQVMSEFTDSGQTLGSSDSSSVALGDLDGDGDLDAMVANENPNPNTVWTNTVTGAGVCCAQFGCAVSTENLAGYCEQLGGIYITSGSCEDCPARCIADIVVNEHVDVHDLLYLLGHWGACP
ncbi:MAG: hypothetical protein HOI89_09910 [Phycisphaerae bacterium]|nr:hypothetical protein [Phycisphaerae bacterium]